MKKPFSFLSIVLVVILYNNLFAQQSMGLKLLGHWNDTSLNKNDGYQIWNDLTGYSDLQNNKEYVIAGSADSIYFFDISEANAPKVVTVKYGACSSMVNRDFECYSHYVYCVSDNKNRGKLQIFDLQYLPDSVHLVYESDSLAHNTHSIFIDSLSSRLYMCTNRYNNGSVGAVDIVSIVNPAEPVKIGSITSPKMPDGSAAFKTIHELYARNDTIYCSAEYAGLYIYDVRNAAEPNLISVISQYPQNGYNHNSCLDKTGKKMIFTDEIPSGLSIKYYDLTDVKNPKFVNSFQSNSGATAHNAWYVGNFAYVSYYHDGLYVFDLTNPLDIYPVAYFHSSNWPPLSYEGYKGCWGVHPYFKSGNIAILDMGEGLFVLKPDPAITGINKNKIANEVLVFPNPSNGIVNLEFNNHTFNSVELELFDIEGKSLLQKQVFQTTFELDLSAFVSNQFILKLKTENQIEVRKLIKFQ